ncbi:tetA [Symbiodinium natans]|uniref:TetA protein n=1 Tax=Symbiodinium natans TaxID=878477 RepID=A0A812IBD9_9DINO|nr:tetA [Symbiodinium natans]
MLSWRTLCLCLLLALVGAAWAELTDTEDGCQLEILKRPGKGKAANAKNKGRRRKKWFELLKIKSKGSAKQKAHAHRAKAKGRKTEPRLDTQNKFSDVPEVDELQVQKKPAKKQLHKHDGKAKPSLDMELDVSRDRRSGLTKGKQSFGFSGHEAAKEKGAKGKHGKSHGPTFAVTTRVYSAELPYLKHFLSYYLHDLKVERVYLFCTKKSEESQIRAAVRGFGFSEKQVTFVRGRRNASLQRLNYHAVHEDFLLDVDAELS